MRLTNMRRISFLSLVTATAVAACGDNGGGPSDDPDTTDSDADAGTDVTTDAEGSDTTADAPDDTIDPGDGSGDTTVDCDGVCIPGLSAPVNVRFDARGVAHLDCANDEDCAAAMGYFHARDRFLQMDIRRRLVTGRLAEIVNVPQVLDLDVANRRLYSTFDGEPLEAQVLAAASPEVRAQLEAYARGVNAWIGDLEAGRNGARLAREYDFPLVRQTEVAPWTPEDSVAGVLALVESLINLSGEKLGNGTLVAEFGEDGFNELFGLMPISTATTYESFGETFTHTAEMKERAPGVGLPAGYLSQLRTAGPALAEARAQLARTYLSNQFPAPGSTGSNNWVVSAERSATGHALLANDPHLALSQSSIWYLAHIDSETNGDGVQNSTGVTFAGLPWVILGQNADLAWGATASYLDLTDVYVETLTDDGEGVVFNGDDVPFVRVNHEFTLFDGTTETRELLFVPHHGPVLSIDEEAGTAVTLRWAAQDIGADINVLLGLAEANTVEEARDVLEQSNTLGQNWIVADSGGNIGWFPYNRVPYRTWATEIPNWLPLPGDGSAEWEEYWEYADLPQAYNPEAGVIATANSDMTGALADGDPTNDGYPPVQFSVDEGLRQERIIALLEATELHSIESMHAIQGDIHSLLGEQTVPAILDAVAATELSTGAATLVGILDDWDYSCPTGLDGTDPEESAPSADPAVVAASQGCLAFHLVFNEIRYATYDDESESDTWDGYPYPAHMAKFLAGDERLDFSTVLFDDVTTVDTTEGLTDVVVRALDASAEFLSGALGEDPATWLWGRVHVVELRADLFDQFGVPSYNNGPYANDGGNYTVDVANITNAREREFDHRSGASMRFVCEMIPGASACSIQLPGGQSQFKDDPNYDSFLQDYLQNIPYALSLDFAAVEGTEVTVVAAE